MATKIMTYKVNGIKGTYATLKRSIFARVYMNVDTNHIWANQYADCNSSTIYESENIIEVCSFNTRFVNLKMSWIKEQCENAINEYNMRIDLERIGR